MGDLCDFSLLKCQFLSILAKKKSICWNQKKNRQHLLIEYGEMQLMLECLLFIFYLLPCLHLLISWQFSLCEITLHTHHGWWFLRPKQDVLLTKFQLIYLRDFLHLIGRSVKQISLAARSKYRRDADVEHWEYKSPEWLFVWAGMAFCFFWLVITHLTCIRCDCIYIPKKTQAQSMLGNTGEAGQQPAYADCLFWTQWRLIYTC